MGALRCPSNIDTTTPPRALPALASSIFNLTSLLQSLPSASRGQAFTKCSTCLFSTTAPLEAKRAKKRKAKKHKDPYRLAQARQRKSANLARQKVLQEERKLALGDPVRSQPTPFVRSLRAHAPIETIRDSYLNYFLKKEDVDKKIQEHAASHDNASRALLAIASLDNASSKDRVRINIQRCIEEFGRHRTDDILPPRLQSKQLPGTSDPESETSAIEVPKRI